MLLEHAHCPAGPCRQVDVAMALSLLARHIALPAHILLLYDLNMSWLAHISA